ncbi:MAG: sigma 54-interacting transcriptional regulator [Acidobacteriota bacterium]
MPFRLIVSDRERRSEFELTTSIIAIGSGEGCDVRLSHPAVSRAHARLHVDDHGITLEDLDSSNGTFHRGRRIRGQVRIDVGDDIGFGPVGARIEAIDAADLEAAIRLGDPLLEEQDVGRTATTISTASIQRLVTDMLPSWIDALDAELGPVTMAQRVGASIFETLPVLSVVLSIDRAGDASGQVFRAITDTVADTEKPLDIGELVHVRSETLSCEVRFPHAIQAHAYRSVVESASRFVDLAMRRSLPPQPRSLPEHPALPEPATVVPEVRRIYEDATRIALGDVSVLITGESGTGKEVLAGYLHRASKRRGEKLVALNCAALPRDLLESELFGIEEGVATGVRSRAGCFEQADGGTLFLDEIGDMAAETQARILRVLQEREVYRLGGREPRSADVRIIAATNRPIDRLLASGDFRSDLYHRVADWRVELPPLRRRRADITNLAAYFLSIQAKERGLSATGLSRRAVEVLEAYGWPGNIRQLEREIARAVLFLEPGQLLQSRHLQGEIRKAKHAGKTGGPTLRERLEAAEQAILEDEIRRQDGNIPRAAEALAIGRSTIYRRIQELGVKVDDT